MFFWIIESLQILYRRDTKNALRAFQHLEIKARNKVIQDMKRRLSPETKVRLDHDAVPYFIDFMRRDAIFRSIFYARCREQAKTDHFLRNAVDRSKLHLPEDPTISLNSDNIGGGLVIYHGPIVIGEEVKIGNNLTISGGVFIGKRHHMSPIIGDDVQIHAHAAILGPVTIGDHAVIGAGTMVLKDVPENVTVIGNPARILHDMPKTEDYH